MGRSSILLIAAALLIGLPTLAGAQEPPTPPMSPFYEASDHSIRMKENNVARGTAAQRCDLPQYRKLLAELYQLLLESNALLEANKNAPKRTYYEIQSVNQGIRRELNDGQQKLAELEKACAGKTVEQGGDIGTVGSTTPITEPEPFRMPADKEPPLPSLEYLHRWAHVAFNNHQLGAARCNLAEMRVQRNKLETFARAAEQFASKLRRRAARTNARTPEVEQANAYANTIRDLWKAALAQQPMNCPTAPEKAIQVPSPPTSPVPPTKKTQDCPVPGTPGSTTPPGHGMRFTPPDKNAERMLAAHNRARAEVGAPPLAWDSELAAGAAQYAAQMSTVGRAHAPRTGRECVRENLLQSLPGGRTPEEMVGVWIAEKAYFRSGIFPNVSSTGDWSKVGHYTQVIWSTTTHLGCAVHTDARYDWTVCRYSPPGNIDGRPVM